MKRKLFLGILGLFLVLSCAGGAWSDETKGPCTIMKPDRETRLRWIRDYEMAPRAYIDKSIDFSIMPGGSLSLLSHLQYIPSERNQASCGNCWAWAGTGAMGIALDIQESIFDRLSVQFISSCNTAKSCCDGGWLSDLAEFYTFEGYTIPWSNTNADWQNGDGNCNVLCASIATLPSYDIDSIEAQTIETHGVGQAQAIANIKNVLNQNKAVWFAWFLATGADWDTFRNFWNTQGETVTTNLDYGCGHTWDSEGGGHAVLCVGYNDDDPGNSYWIMVNSWGTAGGGRPNGIFRLDMDIDYGCVFYDDGLFWSYYWQTLDVDYGTAPAATTEAASSITSSSATLNGTVNPGMESTTYYFEYGTTTDYGSTTTSTDVGSGADNVSVSANIEGLTANTTYHCRLRAENKFGVTYGANKTFNTPAAPPTVTTGTAASVGLNTVTLEGTVNPNHSSTTYYFEYGKTTDYGSSTTSTDAGSGADNVSVSVDITGLSACTAYHYRIVATNTAGTTRGIDKTFSTDCAEGGGGCFITTVDP